MTKAPSVRVSPSATTSGTSGVALSDSELQLVNELKAGCPNAVEQLLKTSWGPLVAKAEMILGNRHEAEDVVQDSLLRALGRIQNFEPRVAVSVWLKRIVINNAISALRTRNRRSEIPIDELLSEFDKGIRLPGMSILSVSSTEALASNAETSKEVIETIAMLPEELRIPLLLRDLYGYTTKETAEALDLSDANVKIRLHRGRTILRQELRALWLEDN